MSRLYDVEIKGVPKVLADAVDTDPFEIIGFAAMAASTMQAGVGELFDDLAEVDPRLGSVLWATVCAMPLIDHLAQSKPIVESVLPPWLQHLYDAKVSAVMEVASGHDGSDSTYLVEVAMVPDVVTTCVFRLRTDRHELVSFSTVAAPIDDVADFERTKSHLAKDQCYATVPLDEGCQNLLLALDGFVHESHSTGYEPPWPMNLPTAALVIELALGQIDSLDDLPYLAARRAVGGGSPLAKRLRRSLASPPRESEQR